MVTEEGGEAHTINLCKRCFSERLARQGKQPVKVAEWRDNVERKAYRGRLWKVFGMEQFLRGMWEHFTIRRAWSRTVLADVANEKQEGLQGQWQRELLQGSPGASYEECRHGVQCQHDAPCVLRMEATGKALKRNSEKKVRLANGPLLE